MNDPKNEAAVSDKAALSDTELDQVSGGGVLKEVVSKPPPTKPSTHTSGGITHEDTWNSQT